MSSLAAPSLPRLAGLFLLLDLLQEDRGSWIRFLLQEIPREALETDEGFVGWLDRLAGANPELVGNVRSALRQYRARLSTNVGE